MIPRSRWRFVDGGTVALDGGFEPGRIYDVVYRTADPRVLGCGLAGTRDLVSFFKHDTSREQPDAGHPLRDRLGRVAERPLPPPLRLSRASTRTSRGAACSTACSIRSAAPAADRSTTASARRRATRCSTSTSCFPVDLFPFTDGPSTDPETGTTDSLLARARAQRHGAEGLPPADQLRVLQPRRLARAHRRRPARKTPTCRPTTRVYMIASAPHGPGPFPPAANDGGGHGRPRGAEPAELLGRRARAVPRARSLGRRGRARRRRAPTRASPTAR